MFLELKLNYFNISIVQQPSGEIPELGSGECSTEFQDKENNSNEENGTQNLQESEFLNSPILTWSYTDHEKKCDFVYVAAPIVSGSREIEFLIAEDGMSVIISYVWPKIMYNANDLFEDEIFSATQAISHNHPKVHALTSHLRKFGITENSFPKGKIVVKLPIRVQREIGSWKKKAISKPDTKIILLQLKGFQEDLIIRDADTRIVFDHQ